jgi:type IV pilus assembly protein PilM
MNLKKEIKLSDLVPRRRKAEGNDVDAPVAGVKTRKKKASKKQKQRNRELVGLKIGATQIAAARVANNGRREVLQLAREPLGPGIIAAGEVRDPVALGDALTSFFTKHRLPRKAVRLGLANSRIGVRVIEIAGITDERQLENAIRFQAHETLSVPLDEAVIDWHVLSEADEEAGGVTRRVLLVVAYRESVDRYLAAADQAGLELAGIDLEAFALLRAVSDPVEDGNVAVVAVTVGHERTTLAISNGRVCEFTRVLEWGGTDLSGAIARALKISAPEADELKHVLSFGPDATAPHGLGETAFEQAVEAARFELQTLVRELLSSLRFYQSQPGSLEIGEILLAGGTAAMPGFPDQLERELGVAIRVADPLARVRLADSVDHPGELGSLAIAVGLGIED